MARERTYSEVYAQKQRAFRHHQGAIRSLACKAHPETGGNTTLVGNWGNDEARRLVDRCNARWQRYAAICDVAYYAAMHRDHEREGRVGAYTWCDHCKPFRAVYEAAQRKQPKAA